MTQTASEDTEKEVKANGFRLIGEFIYWFSQLDFTIRLRLSRALSLPDELSDPVTSAYDFAKLCSVTSVVLAHEFPGEKGEIEQVFKKCKALNDDRVRIAHGLWTHGNNGLVARHVSRQKLQPEYFFENGDEVTKLTETAHCLIVRVTKLGSEPDATIEILGIEYMRDDES